MLMVMVNEIMTVMMIDIIIIIIIFIIVIMIELKQHNCKFHDFNCKSGANNIDNSYDMIVMTVDDNVHVIVVMMVIVIMVTMISGNLGRFWLSATTHSQCCFLQRCNVLSGVVIIFENCYFIYDRGST